MSEWQIPKSEANGPDKDFEVSFYNYEKNIWFVKETWNALQSSKVPNIYIHIENGTIPPCGSIAWLNSMVGRKSSIPVSLNQLHSLFKMQFIKGGGRIFREINYEPDVKLKEKVDVDLFQEMRGIDYNSLSKSLPYDKGKI